mgnify:CR=1 FL=1
MPALIDPWKKALTLKSMQRLYRGLNPLVLTGLMMTALLSGCGSNFGFPGVYRIDVEQGNIVTEEMVEQLKLGMTRRQVRFVLGTPLIEDTFHPDRWDYRYTVRNGLKTVDENRLSVFFDGDLLSGVEGPMLPACATTEAAYPPTTDDPDEAN